MSEISKTLRYFVGEVSGCSQNFTVDLYYKKGPLKRICETILQAVEEIENLERQTVKEGHVKIPSSVDEAVAMHLLAAAYLEIHAPHMMREKKSKDGGVDQ